MSTISAGSRGVGVGDGHGGHVDDAAHRGRRRENAHRLGRTQQHRAQRDVVARSHLEQVAEHLRDARRVLFITGAGISADSGLPTYRGVGGLYDSDETEEGMRIEDALSGQIFAVRPDITWKYLIQIEKTCRAAKRVAGRLSKFTATCRNWSVRPALTRKLPQT